NVPRKSNVLFSLNTQGNRRRTQDMSSIAEQYFNTFMDRKPMIVRYGPEKFHGIGDVFGFVQRTDRLFLLFFLVVFGVVFLYFGTIQQHYRAETTCGMCAINTAFEPTLYQKGQTS